VIQLALNKTVDIGERVNEVTERLVFNHGRVGDVDLVNLMILIFFIMLLYK